MKPAFFLSALLVSFCIATAQSIPQTENIFIITTDGFRWQEVFTGADSAMMSNSRFVEDTSLIKQLYWDEDANTRRHKLMPFMWDVIA